MGKVVRFSISAPPDLVKDFDELVSRLGLGRSHAIGLAMRDFITGYEWEQDPDGVGVGALTLIADHVDSLSESVLTEIQHRHHDSIISTTFVHRDDGNCLIVVLVRGRIATVRRLAGELMAVRGVKQLKTSMLASKMPGR